MILLKGWELWWLGLPAGTAGAQPGSLGRWNWDAGEARGQRQRAEPQLDGRNAVPRFPVGSVPFWGRRLLEEVELLPQPCQGKWHFSHYYIWRKSKQFEIVFKFSLEGL